MRCEKQVTSRTVFARLFCGGFRMPLARSAGKGRRTAAALAVLLGAIAALTSGCPASKKPSRIEEMLANMAKDVVIPLEAKRLTNPLPRNDAVVQEGQQVYMLSCALCHGTDSHARTNLGMAMYPPAMDLTSPHVQHWSDAELFWIIQNGVRLTGMPGFKTMISETDTWKLVRFIQAAARLEAASAAQREIQAGTTPSQAELVAYGETLYRQEGCFMCHQLEGEGGKVGPDLSVEGTRGRKDEWLIGHFKDPAAYTPGSLMPPFKNLTDGQLRALVAFLQSEKGRKK